MDLFNDHSDPVESQPTQLLQHALTTATKTVEHRKEWGLNEQREQEEDGDNISKDFSTDSILVPPAQSSTSPYQLNWLAPTQTQPQVVHKEQEMVEEGEDSQKENTPTSNENKHEKVARTRSSSPQSSSTKPIKGSHADSLNPRTASGTGKANVAKSVSFQSPRQAPIVQPLLQPTKSLPAVPSRRQRYPSPPSQDSFGGAVSQDPAANYIAQATQVFEVPLSDLGHTPNDLSMDDRVAHSSDSQEDEGNDSWMDKIRRAYEQTKSEEASGSILVAGTPSQSDASQGSSRNINFPHPDASQLLNDEDSLESVGAQRGRYGSQPNTSQSSLLVAEDESTAEKKHITISEELAPTQPSTPMQNDLALTEEMYARTLSSRSARATAGTTPGPRSLLSLIHPDQRARRLRQMTAQAPPASDNTARQPVQTRHAYAGTQPSTLVAARPSDVLSEDNDVPLSIKQPASRRHPQLPQPRARSIPQGSDNFDVVPDSEPPAPSTATPARDLKFAQCPKKRPFSPLSPMSEHGSGEIVADSVEVPESSQDLEGDVPLAVLLQVKSAKSAAKPAPGKVRSSRKLPPPPPPPVPVKKAKPPAIKPKSSTRGKKNVKKESGEIPTSAPEQDLQDPSPVPERVATPTAVPPSVKKGGRKGKAPVVPARKSTRTRAAPAAIGRKRQHSSDTEASDEGPCQDEIRSTPKAAKQEEEELTDDEDHVEADPVVLKVTSSRKRRRVEDVKPTRAPSKASTLSKTSDTPVQPTKAAQRLRLTASASRAVTTQPATRVFGLWKQDGHYYAGTVYSLQAGTRYLIKFDDTTQDYVDITKLRRCELRIGDAVILVEGDVRGTVVDVTEMGAGSIGVEVDDGSDVMTSNAKIANIRVASRAILSHWKDRTLTADSIVTVVRPKPLQATPSPSKMSLMSATSVKQKKPFAKTGFVVTLTVGNKNPEKMKDDAMLAIKHNGGMVIDDWSSIFSMEGVHSQSNKRWTASQEDFKFRPKPEFEGLERVFLLADDCNQKPKFLVALALGIPCLSYDWVQNDHLNKQISPDWQNHLLPAGFSEPLSARVSQLVDFDWGNCKEHLSDIMSNMVASKLFSGKTILCLGADFVPLPPRGGRKGGADTANEASRFVPWIIICMGASRVEAVTEVKFASKDLSAYDYVVIKEFCERPKDLPEDDDITVAHVPWVKDCLIAGRLLPLVDS
ncbi:hypothetical protein K503DRAFT_740390 [Rhizopogon vinicolor AM-OR11-026]|uniref:DNA repair protein Crb2 Tudor domain-containing protein n=1 Tax=Rhizopogon vinicolor AM-OR11-026 TaxID=1314800 RepID=A0A1B7N250_9AGAM|nr:hypothetical protein K503DRAFT_740390 [Rhizopogon vinicolor AM-OR11-026]